MPDLPKFAVSGAEGDNGPGLGALSAGLGPGVKEPVTSGASPASNNGPTSKDFNYYEMIRNALPGDVFAATASALDDSGVQRLENAWTLDSMRPDWDYGLNTPNYNRVFNDIGWEGK